MNLDGRNLDIRRPTTRLGFERHDFILVQFWNRNSGDSESLAAAAAEHVIRVRRFAAGALLPRHEPGAIGPAERIPNSRHLGALRANHRGDGWTYSRRGLLRLPAHHLLNFCVMKAAAVGVEALFVVP